MDSTRPAPRYETRVLTSPEEIASVAEACAACRCNQRRPQADLGPDQAPCACEGTRLVLLCEDEEIAGFARVTVDTRKYPWRVQVPGRSFVPAQFELSSAEYADNDLIAPENDEARDALLRALLDACADCSVLRLRFVTEDSDLWRMLTSSRSRRAGRWIVYSWSPTPRWLLRVTDRFEDYTRKFSRQTRHGLRRKMRHLSNACDGDLRLDAITDRSQVAEFVQSALAITRVSARACVTEPRFMLECPPQRLERLADTGKLRCYLLRAGSEPIAYLAGWIVDGVFFMPMSAFDSRWERHSPGTMLDYLVIEDVMRSGQARWMDYGYGHLDYKQFFATDGYNELCAYLIRPSIRTALAFIPIIVVRSIRSVLVDPIRRRWTGPRRNMRRGVQLEVSAALADNRTDRCRDMRS